QSRSQQPNPERGQGKQRPLLLFYLVMTSPKARFRFGQDLLVRLTIPAILVGCQENTPPESPAGQAHFVTIQYVCGRNFDVGNEDSVSLSVRFEVAGGESGDLLLPARSAVDTPSMTRLTTWTSGAVQISMVGNAPVKADNVGTACPAPNPPFPEPQASMG